MDDFWSFLCSYHKEFKTALFMSGFTLGAFLLSMKTFILKTMKEEVYDTKEYSELYEKAALTGDADGGIYDPLKKLSGILYKSIVLSFLSALSQITFGAFGNGVSSFFCLSMAFVSWIYVGRSIKYVGDNWKSSFKFAEERYENKNKQEK